MVKVVCKLAGKKNCFGSEECRHYSSHNRDICCGAGFCSLSKPGKETVECVPVKTRGKKPVKPYKPAKPVLAWGVKTLRGRIWPSTWPDKIMPEAICIEGDTIVRVEIHERVVSRENKSKLSKGRK